MKKLFLSLAMMAFISGASAQMDDHIHNIQVNAGGGIHTLLYTPDQGERTIGLGGLIEGQYQLMFNHNWGLAIGVQVSTLRSSANYNYSYAIPNVTLPGANYPADLDIHFYNWRERQSVTLLSIPLRADGTYDEKESKVLDDLEAWMTVNGESIFGTRPWVRFGETPCRPRF